MNADLAVDAIIDDLKDRCGFSDVWDQLDEQTQQEIRFNWIEIIEMHHEPR